MLMSKRYSSISLQSVISPLGTNWKKRGMTSFLLLSVLEDDLSEKNKTGENMSSKMTWEIGGNVLLVFVFCPAVLLGQNKSSLGSIEWLGFLSSAKD